MRFMVHQKYILDIACSVHTRQYDRAVSTTLAELIEVVPKNIIRLPLETLSSTM